MENALFWLVVLMCLFVLFMDVIFALSLVFMLVSKKAKAKFVKVSSVDDSYQKYAYYEIEGKYYRNIFPAQSVFRKKFYDENADSSIRIIKRFFWAIDKLSQITIYLGVVSSAVLSVMMYHLYSFINNFA